MRLLLLVAVLARAGERVIQGAPIVDDSWAKIAADHAAAEKARWKALSPRTKSLARLLAKRPAVKRCGLCGGAAFSAAGMSCVEQTRPAGCGRHCGGPFLLASAAELAKGGCVPAEGSLACEGETLGPKEGADALHFAQARRGLKEADFRRPAVMSCR